MIDAPFLTRFAPSPTGHLHLGHLAHALYVWGFAGARQGRVILRIEDHDAERSRREYERSILDDLEWLGFGPDAPPLQELRLDPHGARQSSRPERYAAALRELETRGLVFWCDCSRQRVERTGSGTGSELRYDGHCRERGLGPAPGHGARVRIEPGIEHFSDGLLGAQAQDPSSQCGDLLVRDRIGQWTYQFAVTVDDFAEGITHVIRGSDLLRSTGRQIRLARLLGRDKPPVFLHHPLILGPTGEKLSKSRGDSGLREARGSGLSPEDLIGRAAHAVGLIATPRPIRAADVASLVESVSR